MDNHDPSSFFQNAVAYLSSSPSASRASNAMKLELYGLFKYLTVGVKPMASKPSIFDMAGRAKWDAWTAAGSKYTDERDDAEKRYLELAKELGWDEGPAQSKTPPQQPTPEVLSDDDDLLYEEAEKRTSAGDGDGMGCSVSAMLRPPESPDNTIHGITIKGDAARLKSLLEQSPNLDVNQLDEYGYTPLQLACDRGHLDVARILLEKGADRTIKDPDDFTPLELAREATRSDVVALLSSNI